MSRPERRRWFALLGVATSGLFLWLTFRETDTEALLGTLGKVRVAPLAIAVGTQMLTVAAMAVRTGLLLSREEPVSLTLLLRSTFALQVGNILFPARAGEVVRIAMLRSSLKTPVAQLLGVTVVERAVDLLSVFVILLLCFALGAWQADGPQVFAIAAVALAVVATPFVWSTAITARARSFAMRILPGQLGKRMWEKIDQFGRGLRSLRGPTLFKVSSVSALRWAMSLASCWLWLAAFELSLPWFSPLLVVAFMALSAAVPSSPGFVGTFHFAAAAALLMLGASESEARSFALVSHAMVVVPVTIVGLPFVASSLWGTGRPTEKDIRS